MRILTQTRDEVLLAEFPPTETLRWSKTLNRSGACSFTVPTNHPSCKLKNLEPQAVEVVLLPEGESDPVFVGPIMTLSENTGEQTVSIGAEGILSYFKKAYISTDTTYTAKTREFIFRTMIADHRTYCNTIGLSDSYPNLSVWPGSGAGHYTYPGEGTVLTYTALQKEHRCILDELVSVAESDGAFDYEITPDRVVRIYSPNSGTKRTDLRVWAGNVINLTRDIDATLQAVLVWGSGAGALVSNHYTVNNEVLQRYGKAQYVYSNTEDTTQAMLDDHVYKQLRYRTRSPGVLGVNVRVGNEWDYKDLVMGDQIRVYYPSLLDPIDEYRKLTAFEVTYTGGVEQMSLTLQSLDEED